MRYAITMLRCILVLVGLLAGLPVMAQAREELGANVPPILSSPVDAGAGRTAQTSSGLVGQRQTRQDAAPNVAPLARIQSRVASRVQNRINNRIDRNYDPQANSASPFEVASDRARTAGRSPR